MELCQRLRPDTHRDHRPACVSFDSPTKADRLVNNPFPETTHLTKAGGGLAGGEVGGGVTTAGTVRVEPMQHAKIAVGIIPVLEGSRRAIAGRQRMVEQNF